MALSISIIVPVYNVENYIKECFFSVAEQLYSGPMECLFIDDCGTDNSIKILKGLIEMYKGPIDMKLLHHEENKGLSAARNTGIRNAKGDYIFLLDSDDYLYPHTIESLASVAINEQEPDMIQGSYNCTSPNLENMYKYNYCVLKGQPCIAKHFLQNKLCCMATNELINRKMLNKNQLFFKEGILHEDYLWSFEFFHMAAKVVSIPEATYFYRIHDSSIMQSSPYERRLESTKKIYDEILSDISVKRYEIVGFDSVNHIKRMLNAKCVDVLFHGYYMNMSRDERLREIAMIPNNISNIIINHWHPNSVFQKLLKVLYRFRFYRLFNILVHLVIVKRNAE